MIQSGENRPSAAEAMVRLLRGHGVDTIFGLCGDTSLPFYDAFYRAGRDIRHVLTRDERHAAYMADAYARVTGRVGVCEGPSGGGATYILPGLVEANESSIPVLAITTDIGVRGRGRYTLTELDQEALFRPVTKWNATLDTAANVPRMVRRAFREMTTHRPGSVHLGFPIDVQQAPVDEDDVWGDPPYGRFPARRVGPDPDDVSRLAGLIEAAQRPLIICGGGVVISGAEAALRELAEALGAAVATTISGQGSITDDHALAVGVVGSNGGTALTRVLVEEADLVIFIGCRAGSVTTERWRHPAGGSARIGHIDVDPAVIGANYATDAGVVGDARLVLDALNAALGGTRRNCAEIARRVRARRQEKYEAFAALARCGATPIRPERVVAELQDLLPADAVIVADPGTPCPYFSAYYDWRVTGRHFISNRAHGALGYALAAAVGAHYGRPETKTVAVMGDGSFGMAVGELETVVRAHLPIAFVVFANSTYGWIKAGQKAGFSSRFFSVDFGDSDHAAIAAAYGLKSWCVRAPDEIKGTLARALEAEGPTLVEIKAQSLEEAQAPVSEWIA